MPLVLADRVNETTTTTSTGTITLAGAVSGYQSFAVIGNGNTTYYTIVHQTANEWEVGIGTYTSAGTLLSRDTVLASSNSGSPVNFSAGTKFVFCDYPAGRAVYLDTATNVTIPGLTLSGGTANGVLYLNGSKVATSGTALTFDGTAVGIGQASGTSSGFSTAPNLLVYGATNANILVAGDSSGVGITSARYANTTGGGILRVGKYRGTYASPSAAQTGDTAGDVRFEVWGGSNLRRVATIAGTVETFTSDTDISGYLAFNTTSSGSTTPTEKMRLTAAGNLGIGVTSPGAKLDVVTGTARWRISNDGSGNIVNEVLDSTGAAYRDYKLYGLNLISYTSGVERMRLDSSGNLGIGTSGPVAKLDVVGGNGDGIQYRTSTRSVGIGQISSQASLFWGSSTDLTFFSGSELARFTSSGNLGIGTTSPAAKLHVETNSAVETDIARFRVLNGANGVFLDIGGDEPNRLITFDATGVAACAYVYRSGGTERMRLDSSGNLGLGVTPRAWAGGYKSFDITGPGAIASTASGDTFTQVANGAWFNGTNWIYQYTGVGAARYQMTGPSGGGNHSWHVAATGTAGNTVSFTQAMTLTAAGILCVGATSNTSRGGGNTTLLTYKASGTNYLDIQCGSSGDSGLLFSTASSGNYGLIVYSNSVGALLFYTTSTERMRIDSSGNLGLGTTAPRGDLDVGTATASAITKSIHLGYSSANFYGFRLANTNTAASFAAGNFLIQRGTTAAWVDDFAINNNGNVGIGTGSPNYKLVVSNSGAEGFEFVPGFTTGLSLLQTYNRTTSAYDSLRFDSADYRFTTGGTERARITSNGNLLLGTTSETAGTRLKIVDTTPAIRLEESGAGAKRLDISVNASGEAVISAPQSAQIIAFSTVGSERARITSGGYSKFSNTGTYSNSALYHEFYQTNNNTALLVRATNSTFSDSVITVQGDRTTTNGTYYLADFYNGNVSGRFRVLDSGNAQNTNNSYAGTSDIKLKQDIVDASSQWDDIKSLRIRKYRFKHSPDAPLQIGLVAQESETVSPGLVEETIDRDEEGNDLGTTTKSVKYSVLYMKAVKALQEAMARIEQLEAKFAALESK